MAHSFRMKCKPPAADRLHCACLSRLLAALGSRRSGATLLLMAALLLAPLFVHAGIIHVDADAGGADDGSSWADAFTDLQDALAAAVSGDEIWVAAGVYKPTDGTDRTATFQLINAVEIYGGFDGNETERDQRDWLIHITVLSGDIDNNDTTDANGVVASTDDIVGANSYHVTTGSGTDATAILDGFVITAGLANGTFINPCGPRCGGGMDNASGSPTLANLHFSGNHASWWGGGMANRNNSSPTLTHVRFSGNNSDMDGGGMANRDSSSPTLSQVSFTGNNSVGNGGGMYNLFSSPVLTNVSFSGNYARLWGGGMFNNQSSPVVTNVSFSGNFANNGGGMFNVEFSSPTIRNSIFWNNDLSSTGFGPGAGSIGNRDSAPQISYSLIQGCNPGGTWTADCGSDNSNNLDDANPLFYNTPDPDSAPTTAGNLRLSASSPALDAGNNDHVAGIASDLVGNARIANNAVDLGPYERPSSACPTAGVIYVDRQATEPGDGASWASAYHDLQDALLVEDSCEVWVAAGVYKPTDDPTHRAATFRLKNGVEIYGGFAGSETGRDQRNPHANLTVLSGDIDNNDTTDTNGVVVNADDIVGANSINVTVGSGTDATAVLDGFVITAGLADGTWVAPCGPNCGGGMYNVSGSPTLANLHFIGHRAGGWGGAMYNRTNSDPTLTNVSFSGNRSTEAGAMYNRISSPTLINVTFSGNFASNRGGGMYNRENSNAILTNVSFSGNDATQGGGMHNEEGSNPVIRNSIFWHNVDSGGIGTSAASIVNDSSTAQISYSLIQGCNPGGNWNAACGSDEGNNLEDADPLFFNTPDPETAPTTAGNLRLSASSPALDAGNNAVIAVTTDLVGNARIANTTVDLGPYERPSPACPAAGAIHVSRQATEPGDGTSWASAYRDLQDALLVEESCEVWVAAGLYKPTDDPTHRTASFQLKNGVEIYGGFAGNETERDQRDWSTHITVLSGDIDNNDITDANGVVVDTDNVEGDNSFRVVIGSGTDATAIFDGFVITAAGVAEGSSPFNRGGGMYNEAGNPTLTNLTFIGNLAASGGGMHNRSSSPTLNHVTFIGNLAASGGGMHNALNSSPTLTHVSFIGNRSNNRGGGMHNVSSSPTLTHVSFSGNSAGNSGGGMLNNFSSSPALTHVTFSGNLSISGGGMSNMDSSNPTLKHVSFVGNSVIGFGGGMTTSSGSPNLTNVSFSGNQAESGGGMFNISGNPALINVSFSGNQADRGGGMHNENNSSPTLTNVSFSGNRAEFEGGGIYNNFFSDPVIRNSVFWNNQDDSGIGTASASLFDDFESTSQISFSLVHGCNPGGNWNAACGSDEGNNLEDANPLFLNTPDPGTAPTTVGNLRLQAGSPAIDAGNDAFIDDIDNAVDLDGNPRKFGDAVDLGPYEYFELPDPLFHDRFQTEQ